MPHATLIDILRGIEARRRPELLRYRSSDQWRSLSAAEFAARVRRLAAFLIDFGVAPGDRVAILSENRPEWVIGDFAIQASRAVNVPLFPSLSVEQIVRLLTHSGSGIVMVGGTPLVRKLADALRRLSPAPKILLFDEPEPGAGAGKAVPAFPDGAEVARLAEAYEHGLERLRADKELVDRRMAAVQPGDVASIIYTSGTTAEPKGVMLTHGNLCSNVDACVSLIPFTNADLALSMLPLSHIFERAVEYMYLSAGAAVAYVESPDKVAANLRELRPTVLSTVPRFLEKIHARILETVAAGPPWKRRIFSRSLRTGRARLAAGSARAPSSPLLRLELRFVERFVFAPIKEMLGGRLRFIISGGAPLGQELCEFFHTVGITVLEGYGMTETSPVIAVNTFERLRPGSVGPPIPEVQVRIAEDGEIEVKGPNVMKGYFGDAEATREVMRGEFIATGDVGRIDKDGFLYVTDRKKDLLITSGGKNVSPQPLESAIKSSPYVTNALLIGDRRRFIAALIVPDFDAIGAFARARGLSSGTSAELIRRDEIRKLIEEELERTTAAFATHERVKRFALLERDFSIEADELTPTLKIKRRIVAEHFGPAIESLYK